MKVARTLPVLLAAAALSAGAMATASELEFADDFEGDLSGWELVGAEHISIADSGSPEHGRVLVLEPGGSVFALVRGSEGWGPIRFELDVLFPDDADNYLGVIYNYRESGTPEHPRTDFGSLYIKGNGSYIRANPWRDGNVSRLLYEEYKTRLEGDDAIEIGSWQRVAAEIDGRECHLYVGDMSTPKITFDLYEGDSGRVGVNPRVAGWPVWVDNVGVTSIDTLSYEGPPIPEIPYEPDSLITEWEVLGPFAQPIREVERASDPSVTRIGDSPELEWRPFGTDRRGAVVTGRITEYDGSRPVAYFRTIVESDSDREAVLRLSTTDEITMWVNEDFYGFTYRNGYVFGDRDWNAWWDFDSNPEHAAARERIRLREGRNQILLRVRNGQFASGGFFAALAGADEPAR